MTDPIAGRGDALDGLIAKWRAEKKLIDTFHATMGTGYGKCADELEAALRPGSPALADAPRPEKPDV